jgi:hypothetical protein
MFGKTPRLTPLELQKQLLIAESEINRIGLVQDWEVMGEGVGDFARRAKSIRSIASTVAFLAAGLAAFRRSEPKPPVKKRSRLQSILKVARMACSIWLALRDRSRNRDGNNSANESASQKSGAPSDWGAGSLQSRQHSARRNGK